ncbi:MAG: hypothetical protein IJP22_01755 [Clostridia bacterium]|nr:hypothetical protein [Clostridia bacterium]
MKKVYSKPLFNEKEICSQTGIANIDVNYKDIVIGQLSSVGETLPDGFYE